MSVRPVLVMAGGTGGHVFPGLAVARALSDAGVPVAWLGTRRGLESKLVPPAGIPISYISVGGLRGKTLITRLLGPLRIAWAIVQSLGVMLRLRPRTVLGMGGFVSGPGGVAAWLTRCPLVIHEQNAVAGLTNRLLSKIASRVLEAFPDSFPAGVRSTTVGNPVRQEISALPPPSARMSSHGQPARLLVFGGSQGARRINELVPAAIALLPADLRPKIIHQTGELTRDLAVEAYAKAGVEAEVVTFIDDMARAYDWADLAVCRAGALTVSELAAAGLGAIMIPFPAAVDDHQTRNAGYLAKTGAGVIVQESDLSARSLSTLLEPLLAAPGRRREMAEAARSAASPDALADIVSVCLAESAGGRS